MTARKPMKPGLSMRYIGSHAAARRHPQAGPASASKSSHLNMGLVATASTTHNEPFPVVCGPEQVADGFGSRILVGTAEPIADDMEAWCTAGAADGFNICPAVLPVGLDDLAGLVIPELRRRGLFRTHYEGSTLRQNLGLAMPVSRYA